MNEIDIQVYLQILLIKAICDKQIDSEDYKIIEEIKNDLRRRYLG